MKKLLYILFFFSLVTQICFAQWFWQNPLPQGQTLNEIYTFDQNSAMAVGEAGTIIKTADGGNSWVSLTGGGSDRLNSVYFKDSNLLSVWANATARMWTIQDHASAGRLSDGLIQPGAGQGVIVDPRSDQQVVDETPRESGLASWVQAQFLADIPGGGGAPITIRSLGSECASCSRIDSVPSLD